MSVVLTVNTKYNLSPSLVPSLIVGLSASFAEENCQKTVKVYLSVPPQPKLTSSVCLPLFFELYLCHYILLCTYIYNKKYIPTSSPYPLKDISYLKKKNYISKTSFMSIRKLEAPSQYTASARAPLSKGSLVHGIPQSPWASSLEADSPAKNSYHVSGR